MEILGCTGGKFTSCEWACDFESDAASKVSEERSVK